MNPQKIEIHVERHAGSKAGIQKYPVVPGRHWGPVRLETVLQVVFNSELFGELLERGNDLGIKRDAETPLLFNFVFHFTGEVDPSPRPALWAGHGIP